MSRTFAEDEILRLRTQNDTNSVVRIKEALPCG